MLVLVEDWNGGKRNSDSDSVRLTAGRTGCSFTHICLEWWLSVCVCVCWLEEHGTFASGSCAS